jgi:hypothetical protein
MATYIPQKDEDSVATSGDKLVPVAGVRNDSAVSKTDTDGDYSAIATDAAGRVGIADLGGSITVDGTVGITVGTAASDLGKAEDSVAGSGDTGVMALAVRRDAVGALAASNDYHAILLDRDGQVWTAGSVTDGTAYTAGTSRVLDTGGSVTTTAPTYTDGTVRPLSLAPTGGLRIDDGGKAITIKGEPGNPMPVLLTGAGASPDNPVYIASPSASDNVKIWDGTDTADVLDLTNANPLAVAIVDSTGTQISSFGGGTQYTEDIPAATDPVGTVPILVRSDTPAAQVSAAGDNIAQRGTNFGAAYSQIVTSAGAFVDTFGGGTEYTEDAASAADPVGGQIMSRRRDTLSATEVSADNDVIALNATSKGELYVKQTDVVPVNDNAGSLTVDAPVGTPVFVRLSDGAAAISTLPVSADTELPTATVLADDTANPTVPGVGSFLMAYDGTNWDRVRTGAAASGALKVDGSAVIQPVSLAANQSVNLTLINGSTPTESQPGIPFVTIANATGVGFQSATHAASYSTDLLAVGLIAELDDTAPTTATENTFSALRMSPQRGLHVTLRDGASNSAVTVTGNALNVNVATDTTKITDNSAFTDGTTKISMSGYVLDDTIEVLTSPLIENDGAAARIDSKRAQVMVIEDSVTRTQKTGVSTSGDLYTRDREGYRINEQNMLYDMMSSINLATSDNRGINRGFELR